MRALAGSHQSELPIVKTNVHADIHNKSSFNRMDKPKIQGDAGKASASVQVNNAF